MKSLSGYKTKWRKIWRPGYVTRRTSPIYAASGSQNRTKFHSPVGAPEILLSLVRSLGVVKVITNVTYRIPFEEVAPLRARRKTRLIVHFNRLKPSCSRPIQIQSSLHNVEEDRNLPTDPNIGEHAVERSPLTTAAVISDESDARVRRSARSRHSPALIGDFLLGKDFDNALPPLGRRGECNVAKRHLVPVCSRSEPRVLLL